MDSTQLLLHMYEDQRSQLAFRRSRENEIFIWTASVLLAFVGGALLVSRDDRSALLQSIWGILLASLALVIITAFSVSWQLKQRRYMAEHQKMLVRIQRELGCFSPAAVSFPPDWQKWGHRHTKFNERLWSPSKIGATVVIGALAVTAAILAGILPSEETRESEEVVMPNPATSNG